MTETAVKVLRDDGTEVREGDIIVDFRGKEWLFIGTSRMNTRIYARDKEKPDWRQEFYATVFRLKIERPEEEG